MSHKKFGPDRFSRLDVYWIQQTDRHQNRQAKFIYRLLNILSGTENSNVTSDVNKYVYFPMPPIELNNLFNVESH